MTEDQEAWSARHLPGVQQTDRKGLPLSYEVNVDGAQTPPGSPSPARGAGSLRKAAGGRECSEQQSGISCFSSSSFFKAGVLY